MWLLCHIIHSTIFLFFGCDAKSTQLLWLYDKQPKMSFYIWCTLSGHVLRLPLHYDNRIRIHNGTLMSFFSQKRLILHYSISSMHYTRNCHLARDGNLNTQLQFFLMAVGVDTILYTDDSIQVCCCIIVLCPSSNEKRLMILHYSTSSMYCTQNCHLARHDNLRTLP